MVSPGGEGEGLVLKPNPRSTPVLSIWCKSTDPPPTENTHTLGMPLSFPFLSFPFFPFFLSFFLSFQFSIGPTVAVTAKYEFTEIPEDSRPYEQDPKDLFILRYIVLSEKKEFTGNF